MSTASSTIIMIPIRMPPISPALNCWREALGVTLSFGLGTVVVCCGSTFSGQSGSLKVSKKVAQSLSNRRREEKTETEAEPLDTHDWISETRLGALYVSVPMIMARYTMWFFSPPGQLNSSSLMLAIVRSQEGHTRALSSSIIALRNLSSLSVTLLLGS